jgi:hypothetical protein
MNTSASSKIPESSFKEKAKEEAIKAFLLTIYFAIWFCALAFLVAVINQKTLTLSLFGFAFIKAALCAKFMLIAQAAYPLKLTKTNGILNSLILESIFYLLVVLALNYIEAGVNGLIHGKEFISSMANFGMSDPMRVFAMSIVYWLIVWPYLLFMGFRSAVGSSATIEILFGKKT